MSKNINIKNTTSFTDTKAWARSSFPNTCNTFLITELEDTNDPNNYKFVFFIKNGNNYYLTLEDDLTCIKTIALGNDLNIYPDNIFDNYIQHFIANYL